MKQYTSVYPYWRSRAAVLGLMGAILVLSACSSGPQAIEPALSSESRPNWVINPPQASDTVYGVGGAPVMDDITASVQQARQAATVNMVTNLRVQIMAESRASVSASDGAVSNQFDQDISSVIPDIQLDETRLEETWEDPKGYLYTLVSLDRRAAAQRVRHRFELDRSALSPPADDAGRSLWQGYVEWQRAMNDVAALEARNDLHNILAGAPVSNTWPQQRSDYLAQYESFMSGVAMSVDTPGALGSEYVSMIREAFRETGIGVSSAGDAHWALTVTLSEETQQQGGMHYNFVTTSAALADDTGVNRWQSVSTERGIAGSSERARQQGVRSALATLSREFQTQFD